MAGFNVMDMLNKTSKEGIEEKPKARFRTKDIDIYNIYANEDNISDQIGIDEKAAEIKLLGLLQPLEVMYEPNQSGEEYKLIGGERRWRALKKLVEEEDLQEFREATCQIRKPRSKNEEIIELCISNSYRKATPEKELERIKLLTDALKDAKAAGEKIMGYDLSRQEAEADETEEEEETQIEGQMELERDFPEYCPEQDELEKQALEAFAERIQRQVRSEGIKNLSELKEYMKTWYKHSGGTLCGSNGFDGWYSCEKGHIKLCKNNFEEIVKKTVNKMADVISEMIQFDVDAAEEQKTERVEIPQTNKVEVPEIRSDERRHRLKLASMFFDAVDTGKKSFELQKNDRNYKIGDIIELHEMNDGEETGRVTEKQVIYVLEGFKGLEEGYCILGLDEKER